MGDYSSYESIIKGENIPFIILMSVFFLVLSVLFFWTRRSDLFQKKDADDREARYVITVTLLAVMCGILIWIGITGYKTVYDIQKQAYVIYEGAFTVEKRKDQTDVILKDADQTVLDLNDWYLADGEYRGRIIYGEKTEIVVEITPYH